MENIISASEYFEHVKKLKQEITLESLKESYSVILSLAQKYKTTGQIRSLQKLSFISETLCKEEKVISLGITTFVYREDIEEYIEKVANNVAKVIELKNYTREIPDELIETIKKTENIFDEFYVVFTDYTGKEEQKIAKERREKDPILFGCFKKERIISDRFYFLGDWIDEYCDLTLDKLVEEYTKNKGVSPIREIKIPKTSEELLRIVKLYAGKDNKTTTEPKFILTNENSKIKSSFFSKIRSIFKNDKKR